MNWKFCTNNYSYTLKTVNTILVAKKYTCKAVSSACSYEQKVAKFHRTINLGRL